MKRTLLTLTLLIGACDGGSSDPDPVVTPTVIDPETAGTIKGKVVFSGTPPANPKLPVGGNPECSVHYSGPALDSVVLVKGGRLQNVFVYVKTGLEKHVFTWPKTSARMANEKCLYVPRVMGAQVHQTVEFANNDPTDHNIHGFGSAGEFNFTLRGKDTSQDRKFRRPDVMMKVRCDLHPWMIGYVGIVSHPYFAVTGEDGAFELKGLPPGEYELEAWHEKYGAKTLKAKLDAKGSLDVEFVFKNWITSPRAERPEAEAPREAEPPGPREQAAGIPSPPFPPRCSPRGTRSRTRQ
jgi:plastocyanin